MFAPPVSKPKAKTASNGITALRRAAPFGQRHGDADRAHMFWPLPQGEASLNAPVTTGQDPGPSWNFGKIPVFSPGREQPFQMPLLPIQAKLKVGAIDDPLEHEADRAADQVMRMPAPGVSIAAGPPKISRIQPKLRAGTTDDPLEWERTAPSPDSFRGRGDPLPAPVRGFFEQQFDDNFGGVRVHCGPDAIESARSLGARAYTYGRDIVFGAGEYSPGSRQARELIAHELAHVVQQGAGHTLVQRSPLSDSVKDAWTADPTIEALLTRLSRSDVQTAPDADVDAEIARILAARPDDLWVAQRVRKGQLGQTTGARTPKVGAKPVRRSIKAFFFRGSTDRRALVIAGVHGSEKQGIEVADRLVHDLQPQPPAFTTIIVPSLFPDNAALTGDAAREGSTPTNRDFPPPSQDLAGATAGGKGTAFDALKRPILPENLLLIELMERFHPERIISIHGTQSPGHAGVFYDRRSPNEQEDRTATELAKGIDGGQELPPALQERLHRQHLAAASAKADQTDRDLALNAASQIDASTKVVKGRESRNQTRDDKPNAKDDLNKRGQHPSVAGNVGSKGQLDDPIWGGGTPGGTSLGGYAPPRGMSVFTVEPPVDAASAKYPAAVTAKTPGAVDEISGAVDKLKQADRMTELQSYADAVRTILLGS